LRARPCEGPFALTLRQNNAQQVYCLNAEAEARGLQRGMGFSDARALCPELRTLPADPQADGRFLVLLARWAGRYCPWVGLDGPDGLVLDVTGSTHLFGGEAAMLADITARLNRAGLSVCTGLAETRGGAWALARFGGGIAEDGKVLEKIGPLPVAALRLEPRVSVTLQQLGLRMIADLAGLPRAALTRRFGPGVLLRLDQALGVRPEQVSPVAEPPRFSMRMTLPEPIGLVDDMMAVLERLLDRLCARLTEHGKGARVLLLSLRRVDQAQCQSELRLARPMREAERILPLFEKTVAAIDAGYGIDQVRLQAVVTEALPLRQIAAHDGEAGPGDALDDLVTRLGNRIGLENILRYLPADSHIPERGFLVAPVAYSAAAKGWPATPPRPLRLFPPEPVVSPEAETAAGREPPHRFRWRRMMLTIARATGPERITPEWWLDDPAWRSGLRDYWRVETREGRRLWLFHTPQNPGWFVQGEFA